MTLRSLDKPESRKPNEPDDTIEANPGEEFNHQLETNVRPQVSHRFLPVAGSRCLHLLDDCSTMVGLGPKQLHALRFL